MTDEELKAALEHCGEPDPKRYSEQNATEADIAAVRASIFEFEPGIIYWYETAYQSEFSIHHQRQKALELTQGWDRFTFLVDLTRANKPDAPTRAALKRMFADERLQFTSLFTDSNVLLNIAARFVLRSVMGETKFSVVKKYEVALQRARDERQKHAA